MCSSTLSIHGFCCICKRKFYGRKNNPDHRIHPEARQRRKSPPEGRRGCDGWEITAHANSAPDHEPIQGKQYSDAAYLALNGSLRRRIGTLNCGHAAFPIILGVNSPQYTPAELKKFRTDNEKGVTVDGIHYTGYEAAQMQRSLERAIRRQKNRIMVEEAAGDKEKLAQDKTRLELLHQRYAKFSKDAGLRTQYERTEAAGFGEKRPLANSTRSGIMEPNRPEEMPDVSRTLTRTDITGRYLETATPSQGTVICEGSYVVKTHRSEMKMADWLLRTFGGDIQLLKESKNPGDKTPDFRWNGRDWELKGVSSKNSVDRAVREAAKQIEAYPGGIILEVSSSELPVDVIEIVVCDRIRRTALDSVDVMIVSGEDLKRIIRYKK